MQAKRVGASVFTVLLMAREVALLIVFGVDALTPLGVAAWLFYLVPVCLTLYSNNPRLPLIVAMAATVLMRCGSPRRGGRARASSLRRPLLGHTGDAIMDALQAWP